MIHKRLRGLLGVSRDWLRAERSNGSRKIQAPTPTSLPLHA